MAGDDGRCYGSCYQIADCNSHPICEPLHGMPLGRVLQRVHCCSVCSTIGRERDAWVHRNPNNVRLCPWLDVGLDKNLPIIQCVCYICPAQKCKSQHKVNAQGHQATCIGLSNPCSSNKVKHAEGLHRLSEIMRREEILSMNDFQIRDIGHASHYGRNPEKTK